MVADAQTLQEENLSEKGSVESARRLLETDLEFTITGLRNVSNNLCFSKVRMTLFFYISSIVILKENEGDGGTVATNSDDVNLDVNCKLMFSVFLSISR